MWAIRRMNIATARPMRLWMRIGLNLLFFFFSFNLFAQCDFKSHISKVYSLSGSITVALKELQLLNNPKLKGISVFNPIGKNQFKGAFLPGGVFLSHTSFNEFAGGVVFFDESRELAKTLMPFSSIQGVEFKTRGLEPLQVVDESIRILSPFLQNCEKEFTL